MRNSKEGEDDDTKSSLQHKSTWPETLCYVCCERQRDSVLQPCGHGGMCYKCSVEFVSVPQDSRLQNLGQPIGMLPDGMPAPRCPLCRQSVHEVLRLSMTGRDDGVSFIAATSWTIQIREIKP